MSETARNGLTKTEIGTNTFADLYGDILDNWDIIDAAIAKCNWSATIDPTANDDVADGYAPGSVWLNITTKNIFVCMVATAGAAVWNDSQSTGWVGADVMTYASADDPTYTMTCSGNKTTKYYPGMRIKLTQTTVKYFIITAVSYSAGTGLTTITLYGGTDYDLASATITLPYYSMMKAPGGFPLSPAKWTITINDTNSYHTSDPTQNAWYNAFNFVIPIGCWVVEFSGHIWCYRGSTGYAYGRATISTANNDESDSSKTIKNEPAYYTEGDIVGNLHAHFFNKMIYELAAKTTYYVNYGAAQTNIFAVGLEPNILINIICAYL
jgi:hypothetical protein